MTARMTRESSAPAPATPLIELRAVSVRYPGAAAAALDGIELTLGHGELITLSGPAGSGKSTLIGVLALLQRPTSGRYLLNGLDTARLHDRERAWIRSRQIGCVLQRPQLLPARSVLDNVMLAVMYSGQARKRRRIAVFEALDLVGLAGEAHLIAGELAAGEQQRVAIARAIVGEPNLLLCDDPTASLDDAAAAHVIGLLSGLRREGRTVLVATRDQLAAAYSSRILAVSSMRQGTRLRQGIAR
jgi:putative ABC transport system ATP-binding protein